MLNIFKPRPNTAVLNRKTLLDLKRISGRAEKRREEAKKLNGGTDDRTDRMET